MDILQSKVGEERDKYQQATQSSSSIAQVRKIKECQSNKVRYKNNLFTGVSHTQAEHERAIYAESIGRVVPPEPGARDRHRQRLAAERRALGLIGRGEELRRGQLQQLRCGGNVARSKAGKGRKRLFFY